MFNLFKTKKPSKAGQFRSQKEFDEIRVWKSRVFLMSVGMVYIHIQI